MTALKTNPGLAYVGAVAVEADVEFTPGRGLAVICTEAGNVSLVFANGSGLVVPVATGLNILAFSVKEIVASGTTATATYANLV